MQDLISRRETIDAIEKHLHGVLDNEHYDEGIAFGYETAHRHIQDVINKLPSALTCKDCDNSFENGFLKGANYIADVFRKALYKSLGEHYANLIMDDKRRTDEADYRKE